MEELENVRLGGVELDPARHIGINATIGETEVSVILPPHRTVEEPGYVVGVEEVIDGEGARTKRYLKIPSRIREAGHAVVEYYETHDNLRRGTKAVAVAAGIVAVGSLTVLRLKNRRS